jgi:hypothetical protein
MQHHFGFYTEWIETDNKVCFICKFYQVCVWISPVKNKYESITALNVTYLF